MKVEITWWKVFGAWQSMSFDGRHWSPSDYSISWPWFFFHDLVLSQLRKIGGSKVSSPDLSSMLKNSDVCCFVTVEAIPKGAQSTHPSGISNVDKSDGSAQHIISQSHIASYPPALYYSFKIQNLEAVNPGSEAIFIKGFVLCSQLFALTSVPIHSPPPDVSKNGLVWLAVGLYIASKVAYFLPW